MSHTFLKYVPNTAFFSTKCFTFGLKGFTVDYGDENDKKRNSKAKTFLVIFDVAVQTNNCLEIIRIHFVKWFQLFRNQADLLCKMIF